MARPGSWVVVAPWARGFVVADVFDERACVGGARRRLAGTPDG